MAVLLGIDVGTSSVKVALWDSNNGCCLAAAHSPSTNEMAISSPQMNWAEQDLDTWWANLVAAVHALPQSLVSDIAAVGIGYQMHGLVLVDDEGSAVRPAIIWCDGRATQAGEAAMTLAGEGRCRKHLLNGLGNLTAAKLAWIQKHEPLSLKRAKYAMLPGDAIALRLTGEAATTRPGLSEMILWDFQEEAPAKWVLEASGIPAAKLPPLAPCFGLQGTILSKVSELTGIPPHTPLTFRAGDQITNALGLGCSEPGQVAATAGTSGVLYAVASPGTCAVDERVNTFLHATSNGEDACYGVLLCVNGCGSFYSWLRNVLLQKTLTYAQMDELATLAPPGSKGLLSYPFGNGVERVLGNTSPGASLSFLDFSRHSLSEVCRAAQEGIAFALLFGMEGNISPNSIRAANTNLFLSDVFAQTVADLTNAPVQVLESDGAAAAAKGAAIGAGILTKADIERSIRPIRKFEPNSVSREVLLSTYSAWKERLQLNKAAPTSQG